MKYIFIAIAALLLAGAGSLILNNHKDSVAAIDATTSDETVTQEVAEVPETDEYSIDPSDMYSVEETLPEESAALISEDEERWLTLMREEEKLARDVYQTLGDRWGMRIFSNIASSEQTHTDAVKILLDRYELVDPVTDNTIGVFTDPKMQQLYDDLTVQGSESLLSALTVGATIEDLDIHDLDLAIADTNMEDIIVVYQNLQKGSRNHMRAFVRQIERNGGTYTPQYISVSDYEDIISSPQERGRIN
jgi:hypothetical protein